MVRASYPRWDPQEGFIYRGVSGGSGEKWIRVKRNSDAEASAVSPLSQSLKGVALVSPWALKWSHSAQGAKKGVQRRILFKEISLGIRQCLALPPACKERLWPSSLRHPWLSELRGLPLGQGARGTQLLTAESPDKSTRKGFPHVLATGNASQACWSHLVSPHSFQPRCYCEILIFHDKKDILQCNFYVRLRFEQLNLDRVSITSDFYGYLKSPSGILMFSGSLGVYCRYHKHIFIGIWWLLRLPSTHIKFMEGYFWAI